MLGPNVVPFQATSTCDLPSFREFGKTTTFYSIRTTVIRLIMCTFFAVYIWLYGFLYPNRAWLSSVLPLFLAVFWGTYLIGFLVNKNGGTAYKQILSNNNGTPPHLQLTFLDEHIQKFNPVTNGTQIIEYFRIRNVLETEQLIILILEHRQALFLQKDTVTGGPLSTFLSALLEHCPNIKRKKLGSVLPGKIVHGLLVCISVVSLVLAILWSAPVQELRENNREIHSNLSYREIAQKLEEFGIHDIPQSVIDQLESYETESGSTTLSQTDKCISLLTWAGMGEYDFTSWEWTPSECGVYWFDSEVTFIDSMYTDFLRGVQALNPEILNFSDIEESVDYAGEEFGFSVHTVSFTWNGQKHTLIGYSVYDWIDLSFAVQLNKILASSGRQLYFAWDQGQGYIVFFGDKSWAKSFERATGIDLNTDPTRLETLF